MAAKNPKNPILIPPATRIKPTSASGTGRKQSSLKSALSRQRVTLEDLRNSRERMQLKTLQRKISLSPPSDRRPPEKLGDFLPQWFQTHVTKTGDVLVTASETLQSTLPEKLWRNIAFGPMQRGLLTLYCSCSTAKVEVDMLLRPGTAGLRRLQIATKGLIFKVKTVVDRTRCTG